MILGVFKFLYIIIEEQFQRIETLVTVRGITGVKNRFQNGIIKEQQIFNTDIHLFQSDFVRLDGITGDTGNTCNSLDSFTCLQQ
ncbi:MAG: hypothetical protein BWZ06_00722 [Bacteroidetes bacterium ADurb.BinA261]|nr:MAG: hypothetical protein BWZ06_00722 [Bacteroidetes bacterium ADurb.BinA261]